jgi:hypothetical protein
VLSLLPPREGGGLHVLPPAGLQVVPRQGAGSGVMALGSEGEEAVGCALLAPPTPLNLLLTPPCHAGGAG